jgi:uncharacterized protein YjdB
LINDKNKGFNGPEESGQPFRDISSKEDPAPLSVSISSHVGMVGWQPAVTDEMVSGTVSQNHPIEAVKASATNKTGVAGSLQYSSHVSWIGWQEWKSI